jgi:hypothetical protein
MEEERVVVQRWAAEGGFGGRNLCYEEIRNHARLWHWLDSISKEVPAILDENLKNHTGIGQSFFKAKILPNPRRAGCPISKLFPAFFTTNHL